MSPFGHFHPINMLNTFLYLKGVTFTTTPRYPLLFSLRLFTVTSNSSSFAVSYLINNFGFSPESAFRVSDSYHLSFQTPENPNSVIKFFRDWGFSNTQINNLIRKAPWLLSCDPCKRLLPKFEFLVSKGVSSSEIVDLVGKYPRVLSPSLKNNIVPTYELVYSFLQSDEHTVACTFGNSFVTSSHHAAQNIRVMLENGVTESNIIRLLRNRNEAVLASTDLVKLVVELKDLGFDPSKTLFVAALRAITRLSARRWKEKVDAFKKWGWSDEAFLEAFKRYPNCMLLSVKKINTVMSFWVDQLGWNALKIVKTPCILGFSLEKRIIPRACVVQYLLAKGLREKSASFLSPLVVSEKVFLEKYVMRFEEDKCQLLKLYQEKINVQGRKEDGAASGGYQMVNS